MKNIDDGVPHGSTLSPLLFNVYFSDQFMFVSDSMICNYANDAAIITSDYDKEEIATAM